MGEGKSLALDVQIDEESLRGFLRYTNPNYDYLGNSISYNISSESNDKPNQGYENSLITVGVGTGFEQYRDLRVNLGINASYDDLKTDGSASASLKKQEGTFSEISANYGFNYDQRDRVFMPTSGSVTGFSQTLPVLADRKL